MGGEDAAESNGNEGNEKKRSATALADTLGSIDSTPDAKWIERFLGRDEPEFYKVDKARSNAGAIVLY